MAEEMGLDFHGSDCTRTADFVTLAPVVGLEGLIHQKEAKSSFLFLHLASLRSASFLELALFPSFILLLILVPVHRL